MAQQVPVSKAAIAQEIGGRGDDETHNVLPDVAYRRLMIVNVVFVGPEGAGDREWVLVDAGVFGTKNLIKSAAEARFGAGSRPSAIVMTHGHFDHVGVLEDLAAEWDVPVWVHELEKPYFDGSAAYPPGDPSVGGGLVAELSPLFPTDPVNVSDRLRLLPADGSVPPMPGWRWVFTPGHSVGHVAFWRESDRTLIAGDAFVTTAQESAYAVAVQEPEIHGPPKYLTIDWDKARSSVQECAKLEPELAVTGHGRAMRGPEMRAALHKLAQNFDEIARPKTGRYVEKPARPEDGSAYQPPS
jgi:glyoxylase-like metal-dependent hydrolase (beta-lactamase superfamily II)